MHDKERHRLQAFVGQSKWEHQPLLDELAIQVAQGIGEVDGVLFVAPPGFPKSGEHSVGNRLRLAAPAIGWKASTAV